MVCLMDDILVSDKDCNEHLRAVQRSEKANVTLNPSKCKFEKTTVWVLATLLMAIQADPEKTEAISGMDSPSSDTDLRRFLGMVNQLGKFTLDIGEISQPLRELLSAKRALL